MPQKTVSFAFGFHPFHSLVSLSLTCDEHKQQTTNNKHNPLLDLIISSVIYDIYIYKVLHLYVINYRTDYLLAYGLFDDHCLIAFFTFND